MSGLILVVYVRQLSKAQGGLRLAANVFEQMPVGIAITDPCGYTISVNPTYVYTSGSARCTHGDRRFWYKLF